MALIAEVLDYIARLEDPMAVRAAHRHMIDFAQGLPGARKWRRCLSAPNLFKEHFKGLLAYTWNEVYADHLGGRI